MMVFRKWPTKMFLHVFFLNGQIAVKTEDKQVLRRAAEETAPYS